MYKTHPTSQNYTNYALLRNRVNDEVREAKKSREVKLAKEAKSNPKALSRPKKKLLVFPITSPKKLGEVGR